MFKIIITQRGGDFAKIAEFSAKSREACFSWAERNYGGDKFNWSVNWLETGTPGGRV
jgi:hypothetical protein